MKAMSVSKGEIANKTLTNLLFDIIRANLNQTCQKINHPCVERYQKASTCFQYVLLLSRIPFEEKGGPFSKNFSKPLSLLRPYFAWLEFKLIQTKNNFFTQKAKNVFLKFWSSIIIALRKLLLLKTVSKVNNASIGFACSCNCKGN